MKKKICSTRGCNKPENSKKLCQYHYQKNRAENNPKTCEFETCKTGVYAKGWCRKHYARVLATGDPTPAWSDPKTPCIDCGEVSFTSGRCKKHYDKWRRLSMWKEQPVAPETLHANSYQHAHQNVVRAHGAAFLYECAVEGCTAHSDQWALMHEAEGLTTDLDERTYSTTVLAYTPLCIKHHIRYDYYLDLEVERSLVLHNSPPSIGKQSRRMDREEAVRLIKSGQTITEVAEELGFDIGAVSMAFKKVTGQSIREYRGRATRVAA